MKSSGSRVLGHDRDFPDVVPALILEELCNELQLPGVRYLAQVKVLIDPLPGLFHFSQEPGREEFVVIKCHHFVAY